ncbi:ER Hsp70 chaperone BiP [Apiospora phragmitis]|uniref:ER Hsp70 chaperone BiP n=1 Tax=Apiospora phragmitis TaxID=2905665 RepID=A0ABR1WR83_9PEZI
MSTQIEIPSLYESLHLNETLTLAKFEELNKDLEGYKTGSSLTWGTDDAKLKPADIDDIIFSGGCSHVPKAGADSLAKLRSQLEVFFGKKHATIKADEAVVSGAAIQGAMFYGYSDDFGCLMDVHPLSIGMEMADGLAFRVIPKDTPVPTRKSVKIMASGDQDQESKVVTNIIEG